MGRHCSTGENHAGLTLALMLAQSRCVRCVITHLALYYKSCCSPSIGAIPYPNTSQPDSSMYTASESLRAGDRTELWGNLWKLKKGGSKEVTNEGTLTRLGKTWVGERSCLWMDLQCFITYTVLIYTNKRQCVSICQSISSITPKPWNLVAPNFACIRRELQGSARMKTGCLG